MQAINDYVIIQPEYTNESKDGGKFISVSSSKTITNVGTVVSSSSDKVSAGQKVFYKAHHAEEYEDNMIVNIKDILAIL